MFRRVFWFGAGAAAGVWATTRVQRTLRELSADSLALRAAGRAVDTGRRLRDFAQEVRGGMAEREAELHDALGLAAPPPPGLPRPAAARRPAPGIPAPSGRGPGAAATDRNTPTAPNPRKEDH
ncbi:DUF6167 family protein [Streptomyces aidingensis]|uniref:Secreted protein n=1 Tax=Streptomyces aidingensis TaxID=910347 RepID=A0A1I1P6P1_9ACTN|nr:DUF6167 family protein [Streptomyces aidingensis]SFD05479.1 hypothetical protein SAMN05421773_1095 [Streptomyces aidingensis]